MIFRKTANKDDKVFYSLGNNFRQTNIVFRKTKPKSQIEVNCLPSFKSHSINKDQPQEESIEANNKFNETSCSTFMKNYIERLKKQRKRQNKKHQSLKSKPPTNSAFDGEGLPLYNMSKPNQILILERVNQNGQRNYMNTISVVSEDLYDIGTAVQKQKQQKRLKTPDNSWINKEKISQIIKEIKNSKKKNSAIEQLAELDSLDEAKQLLNAPPNLPKLDKPSRKMGSRKLAKVPKQKNDYNLKSLEPWKEESNFNEFSIEEYNMS